MKWTPEKIEAVCQLGRDPENWVPAEPDEVEMGMQIADEIADTYTDDDWRYVLNTLSPQRAARFISDRPSDEYKHLLSLLNTEQRASVEPYLVTAL